MILKFKVNNEEKEINGKRIMTSKLSANAVNTSSSVSFGFGSAAASGFNCSISNNYLDNNWYLNYKFENKEFELYHNDLTKIGVFTVDRATCRNGVINLTTSDNMKKFNIAFKGGAFPCTVYELLLRVCKQSDVECATLKENLHNGDCIVKSSTSCENMTCRNIIKAIAELEGGFAIMNQDGQLEIKHFDFNEKNSKYDFKANEIRNLQYEEIDTKRNGIAIIVGEKEFLFGDSDSAYLLENNKLICYMDESDINKIGNNLFNNTKCLFRDCSFSYSTNSNLNVGDFVSVRDIKGNKYNAVIGELNINNNYVSSIQSYGDAKGETASGTYNDYKENGTVTKLNDGKVYMDLERNNLRFDCKGGEYTICKKMITSLTKYSKIHAFVKSTFTYPKGETIVFKVYAGDILLDEFPHISTGENDTFSFPCWCDIPDATECEYKLNVVVKDGCNFYCDTSKTTFSFITYAAALDDTVVEDKYIVEKLNKIELNSLLGANVYYKNIRDDAFGGYLGHIWDVSENQDGSVLASIFNNDYVLYITGNGRIKDYENYSSATTVPWRSSKNKILNENGENVEVIGMIKGVVIGEGITHIGTQLIKNQGYNKYTNLETITIKCNTSFSVGNEAFQYTDDANLSANCPIKTYIEHPECMISAGDYAFGGANIQGDGLNLCNLTQAGQGAFKLNREVKGVLNISSLTSIPARFMAGNWSLESIVFSRNFTGEYREYCFNNCYSVVELLVDRTQDGASGLGTAFNTTSLTKGGLTLIKGTYGVDAGGDMVFGELKKVVWPLVLSNGKEASFRSVGFSNLLRYTNYEVSIDE